MDDLEDLVRLLQQEFVAQNYWNAEVCSDNRTSLGYLTSSQSYFSLQEVDDILTQCLTRIVEVKIERESMDRELQNKNIELGRLQDDNKNLEIDLDKARGDLSAALKGKKNAEAALADAQNNLQTLEKKFEKYVLFTTVSLEWFCHLIFLMQSTTGCHRVN